MSSYPGDDPQANDPSAGERGEQPPPAAAEEQGYWERQAAEQARRQEQQGHPAPAEGTEHTAPITPSGAVFNPTSATSASSTTPYEQQGGPDRSSEQPYGQPGYAPQPPYGQPPQAPPGYPPYAYAAPRPDHPQATLALVLGLVGLVGALMFCGLPLVVSPFAWALGRNAVKEIEASQGGLAGDGSARAGMVMGIIGTVLLVLAVLVLVLFAVLAVAGSSGY